MEILIFLFIMGMVIVAYFHWIIVAIATVIAMASGGFFAGLGVGLLVHFLIKLGKWVAIAYLGTKAVLEVRKD